LQPRSLSTLLQGELTKWQQIGVMGHFKGEYPWVSIDDVVLQGLTELVGAEKEEVRAVLEIGAFFEFFPVL
jgi:kynureninase